MNGRVSISASLLQLPRGQGGPPRRWRHRPRRRGPHPVPAAGPVGARSKSKPTAVVVGGGWAGFGAAWQLIKLGFEVQLLGGAPNPGGLASGWRTKEGRAVEAGIKGFWYHYRNIDALVAELGIRDPFTPFTSSAFWGPEGIQVKAPVFQELPRLPTPLGNFIYTAPYFTSLSLVDRLTALPLLRALLEFDLDEATFAEYDRMSARELFLRAGVSQSLYQTFLSPVLLALLFVPLEQLSAATALAVLHNYVLAHQPDFDVRWARGSVAETIFRPWVQRIEAGGGRVLGGMKVKEVLLEGGRATGLLATDADGASRKFEADYVVLAVGVKALQAISRGSPALASLDVFRRVNNFEGVAVLAVRLWLDRRVPMPAASNVFGGIDDGVAGTFFDLNALQDEYADEAGSVVEVDLYNAAIFMGMSEEEIVEEVRVRYLAAFLPAFRSARVVDYAVFKVPGGVTKFSPGSYAWMTTMTTPVANLVLAGDHVRHGPGAVHGARGLSQEKALVTGMMAGNTCARLARRPVPASMEPKDVEPDEPHFTAARELLRVARRASTFPRLISD